MQFKLNPTQKITTILAIYTLGAIINNFSFAVLIHLSATLLFGLILFFLFRKISGKEKNIYNSIISTLIIFLLLHYTTNNDSTIIYPLLATFITIFSKFFLEFKGSPIINPVALGLLTVFGISEIIPTLEPVLISWWGTNYQVPLNMGKAFQFPLGLMIIAIWTIFWFRSWNKWTIFFSFLITHAILILAFQKNLNFLQFVFSDATIYFFTAIMLVEPKTSPIPPKHQIAYGILAAVVYNLLNYFLIPQPALISLAIANIYFFATKLLKKPQLDQINP